MSEPTRMLLAGVATVLGLGWFLAVEVWRGRTQDNSSKVFWLHLTAPLVAILFLVVAMVLMLNSDRVQRARDGHHRRALERKPEPIDSLVRRLLVRRYPAWTVGPGSPREINSGGAVLGRAGDTGIGSVATPVTLMSRYGAKIDE